MFKIEKGVPLPTGYAQSKYPWHNMEVGDSFEFDQADYSRIRSAGHAWASRYGRKFKFRRIGDGKCRCWRVA